MSREKQIECKICQSLSIKTKYEMKNWRVLYCQKCEFVFVYPLDGASFSTTINDQQTVDTHHFYSDELMASARNRLDELKRVYGSLVGIRILDIGCGNGYFLYCCKQEGMNVRGIEINEAAVDYVQKELNISILASLPPYDLVFENGSFDIVTLWGVVEHLDNPKVIVAEVQKLLRKTGILAIQTPTEDAFVRILVHGFNKVLRGNFLVDSLYQNKQGCHIQCFSRRSIKVLLSRYSFNIITINDSTYNKKYILKKPVFMKNNFKSIFLRQLASLIFDCSKLLGHQNHMIVFAEKTSEDLNIH